MNNTGILGENMERPTLANLERESAIDTTQSFIVQAPAGSGKTELLTQRYLNLLAHVEHSPEEIIAITFTRKAAAEMRTRVLNALHFAESEREPNDYRQTTWRLAKAALARDSQMQWHLRENTNRLRIMTIEALSAYITRQMPLLSRFGAEPNIAEDAYIYYQLASEKLLQSIDTKPIYYDAIKTALFHLDNNIEHCVRLLSHILSKREQWLPHIMQCYRDPLLLREKIEHGLAEIASDKMLQLYELLTEEMRETLVYLGKMAGESLQSDNPTDPTVCCASINEPITPTLDHLPYWIGLSKMMLTKEFKFRKSIDKRTGFPPKSEHKEIMKSLLTSVNGDEVLETALADILQLPPLHYSDTQWEVVNALTQLLPMLVAELDIVFRDHGVVDFIEISLAALRAIGDEDNPTDIALHLDYQIKHLLVDEFQDTSVTQFRLLEKLLSEWQPNDGRSVFLVGDPMQSIYRFRNAEVGLFIRAKENGIASLPLTFLSLTQNFRSNATIVEWINDHFTQIFPEQADAATGAIPCSQAVPTRGATKNSVQYYPVNNENEILNAKRAVQIIQSIQAQLPNDTTAILVRSRRELRFILPLLKENNISYQAMDIDALSDQPEIMDLVSLTKAILHLGDRLSWLSILRAPWLGLSLADLLVIAQTADNKPIWSAIVDLIEDPAISTDGKIRLNHFIPCLSRSLFNVGKLPLSENIENTWVALGGPATLKNPTALANTATFFRCLSVFESENNVFDFTLFDRKIKSLYANPDPLASHQLQIMTIHKSKGLEFDHVILPSLHQKASHDKGQLLLWLERPSKKRGSDLILAPIKSIREDDPYYIYLQRIEKQKLDLEMARLFYVATTRAKKSLHLMFALEIDPLNNEISPPAQNSFLGLLWPHIDQNSLNIENTEDSIETKNTSKSPLQRLPTHWMTTTNDNNASQLKHNKGFMPTDYFDHHLSRHLGTAIHSALEDLAKGIQNETKWKHHLISLGIPLNQLAHFHQQLMSAISNTLDDPCGQWILKSHPNSACEYPITVHTNNESLHYVIDRTFVDEQGDRWIIDYKTAEPKEEALDKFLKSQKETYKKQLDQYKYAFSQIDNRRIRCALYFPLCKAWIEWE